MPDYAVRPGETLLETIEALGLSQVELAERTGQPRQTVQRIIQGQAPVTPEMAVQFSIPDLRQYLTAAYSDDELVTLCADYFCDVQEQP